jgi:hypothetical protein
MPRSQCVPRCLLIECTRPALRLEIQKTDRRIFCSQRCAATHAFRIVTGAEEKCWLRGDEAQPPPKRERRHRAVEEN